MNEGYYFFGGIFLCLGIFLIWKIEPPKTEVKADNAQLHLLRALLGFTFVGVQAYEYIHAYSDLNLKLTSGIYGSTFFMLTGFHGFHVFLGGLMLTIVLRRMIRGDFTAENHFGFEGAAWYWHFVDVVWLGLYIVVYWM